MESIHEGATGFSAISEDGEILQCTPMFRCGKPWTSGDVIVYTDGSLDDEGNTRVFASKFNPDELVGDAEYAALSLEPLEEQDWEAVELILDLMQSLTLTGMEKDEMSGVIAEIMSRGPEFVRKTIRSLSDDTDDRGTVG